MDDWEIKPANDIGLSPIERMRTYRREAGLVSSVARGVWWTLIKSALAVFHRLEVHGREHLPDSRNFVLVANHASHLDTMVIGSLLPLRLRNCLCPLAAGDVFFEALAKATFSATVLNALPIWRKSSSGARAIKELRQRMMDEPTVYVLFPEGTRTRDGQMSEFKAGIGMLVAETPVPVVPCFIEGAYDAMPPDARIPRPRKLRVRIGPQRSFHDMGNRRKHWDEIAILLENDVRSLGGLPIREPPAAS